MVLDSAVVVVMTAVDAGRRSWRSAASSVVVITAVEPALGS